MNISLADALKPFVDEQVRQGSYGTSSEYVRELIRKDQGRLQLSGLLLGGAASAAAAPADPAYFEGLRDWVRNAPKDGARGWRPGLSFPVSRPTGTLMMRLLTASTKALNQRRSASLMP